MKTNREAFADWYDSLPDHVVYDSDVRVLEQAFNAGWKARITTVNTRLAIADELSMDPNINAPL